MRLRHFACTVTLAALMLGVSDVAEAEPLLLHVSESGSDAWSGRLAEPRGHDGPFATLERARDEVRRMKAEGGLPPGGVVVEVAEGVYERAEVFALGPDDSGTPESPITYRAEPGKIVRLSGGRRIGGWQPVTDPQLLARLEEPARGAVLQADLRSAGVDDLGEVSASGRRLELFFRDEPMTIARWPNEGFVRIAAVFDIEPVDVRGTKGDLVGRFVYEGDRPERWAAENDLWLHGYWFWDWSDERQAVESIDTENRVISLRPPYHGYGYRVGQWYYAFNALSELDTPGEWYLDRQSGMLYFWPPAPIGEGDTVVSFIPALVALRDVSYVAIEGFTIEGGRGTAVSISGGTGCVVRNCTIRNMGGWAVLIAGGAGNGVVGCEMYGLGDGGVSLVGGDRVTLEPAGHFVEECHIHHYGRWNRMYQPAVSVGGVGNRVAYSLIHDAPHIAIAFSGNDHVFEFNEIYNVCTESNDAGAMYAGRDWTMRGTVIRHNYLHHINGFEGRGCVGVYLDDMYCGTRVYGNLFVDVTMAAFIGGGRDNVIENNVFVDCVPAVHVDARATNWAKYHAEGWVQEARERGTLSGTAFDRPPYSERYPELPGILDNDPFAPHGNVIRRNVCWGGTWSHIEPVALPMLAMSENLTDEDPLFVDPAAGDYRLRDDSPAWALGFERLPLELMLRARSLRGER